LTVSARIELARELPARLSPEVVAQIDALDGEVIVIDNGSNDGTAAWLEGWRPNMRVKR